MKTRLILLFCFFISFGFSTWAAKNTELVKSNIALNWKAEPEFGGFYTALVDKIYQKNGLDVEVIQGGAGTPTVQMLSAKKIDFAIVSGDELAIARDRGANVVALFTVFQTAPYAFMLRADSKISDIPSLLNSDVTLAVMNGLPYVEFLKKKYGFKKAKVVPYAGGISNFVKDTNFVQQCFISSEPLLAKKQNIKTKTLLIADSGFNPYTAVLAVHGDLIKSKPDLVKKMVSSVREGWKAYIINPSSAHQLITKLNPTMTLEAMKDIHAAELPLIQTEETKQIGLGSMTDARWSELVKQLKEIGLITKEISAKELYWQQK